MNDDIKSAKKKSYSKKPSKKERLEQELAKKSAQERVAAGGVHIRADGVAVSSAALADRQAALRAASGDVDV